MIPTVETILSYAASLLGDPQQRKFTNAKLLPYFTLAYEELTAEMQRYHLPKRKRTVNYALVAGTTLLSPATANIGDMGEIIVIEERPYGSSGIYTKVEPVDSLPQIDPTDRLIYYEWVNDRFKFIGATRDIDLRINYFDSSEAPSTGQVGIDGSRNFLAYRTASIAAIPAGNVELGDRYEKAALGPMRDGGGGYLHMLLQPMVVSQQKIKMQAPAYSTTPFPAFMPPIGVISTDGGSDVGAPTNAVITGTIDGSNDTFTLPAAYLRVLLYRNGALMDETVAYTISGATITFLPGYIPQTGDRLRAEVW
jgi:hypothetical protein